MTAQTPSQSPAIGATIQPKLNPEQMLLRLLELIRTTTSVKDFTPERLHEVMGVEIEYARDGSGRYGFGEQVNSEWTHGFMFSPSVNAASTPRFNFDFNRVNPSSEPAMTNICQVDFEQFARALKAMGFSRSPNYAEHGRYVGDTFERPNMSIEITGRGEKTFLAPGETARSCIHMISIG